jgi:hypothetical protein
MPVSAIQPDDLAVWRIAGRVAMNPWKTFVVDWNWKAALLSAAFRALAFAIVAVPHGSGAFRAVWIGLLFRILIGGFWGSLLQAFRNARPAWLAGLVAAVLLPGFAHVLEFLALKAGHATHVITAVVTSVVVSIGSLLINWYLMRRGMLITGDGSDTLRADFRRLPAALSAMCFAPAIAIRRLVRGRAA